MTDDEKTPPVEDRRNAIHAFEVYEKNPWLAPDFVDPNARKKSVPMFPNWQLHVRDGESRQ